MLRSKLALMAATALVTGVLAVPAFADVNVVANITKEKVTNISVSVDINKDITITVNLEATAAGLAEANAEVNADSSHNTTTLHLYDGEGFGSSNAGSGPFTHRLAEMTDSLNNNLGVLITVNQDVGENVNQGNVISIAMVDVHSDGNAANGVEAAVSHSEAAVSQRSSDNSTEFFGTFPGEFFPPDILATDFHVRAEITAVMNFNSGVVFANQNAGQNNNQHNVMALSVGIDSAVALAEGDLGQETSDNNRVFDVATFKRDLIDSSINGNSGLVAFNQSVGHNNNQATVISIAATSAASNLVPGGGL